MKTSRPVVDTVKTRKRLLLRDLRTSKLDFFTSGNRMMGRKSAVKASSALQDTWRSKEQPKLCCVRQRKEKKKGGGQKASHKLAKIVGSRRYLSSQGRHPYNLCVRRSMSPTYITLLITNGTNKYQVEHLLATRDGTPAFSFPQKSTAGRFFILRGSHLVWR